MSAISDAISPLMGLAGVVLGAALSRGSNRTTWRRDKRDNTYTAALTAARALAVRLDQAATSSLPRGPELDPDTIRDWTADVEAAAILCDLYGSDPVRRAMSDILSVRWEWMDQHADDIDPVPLRRAVDQLLEAARADLDPARRRLGGR